MEEQVLHRDPQAKRCGGPWDLTECSLMKRIIDMSEVVGHAMHGGESCEVLAECEADYDETAGLVRVQLDTFLRSRDLCRKEEQFHPTWLPQVYTLAETVSNDEATEAARDIFKRWVRKVRESVPAAFSTASLH